MSNTVVKLSLKELGFSKSEQTATPGNYRACVLIDSCMYQIGEDISDRIVALGYCQQYQTSPIQPIQIFDDKGQEHIIEGKLKIIYQNENSFLANTISFFDKIMKQKYITKAEIIQLKRQFSNLKEQDNSYNNLFNRITNITNKAIGKNEPIILQGIYEEFNDLK